jgi:hypothetical protein
MRAGAVPAILSGQIAAGSWRNERSYYTPKYVSTHWSMLLLAELDADGADPRVRRGAEHMLAATEARVQESLEGAAYGMSCFWGNLLRYALHCGFAGDHRVSLITDYLLRDALQWKWKCKYNWDELCAWGAARALWGLALLPEAARAPDVEAAIEAGLEFLLDGERLVHGAFPTGGSVHTLWSRLNFPLFYQADVLFILRVATELKALGRDGARPALEWLKARRKKSGRWRGSSPFKRRTWDALSDAEEINRWVSLQAARILKEAPG